MATHIAKMVGDLIEKGQSAEAYTILIRLEAQETKDPELLFQLATLFLALGKVVDAERCLKTTTAIDSDDFKSKAEAHYHLGLALVGQGKIEEAVASFRQSCTVKPDFAMAHLHWGMALASMGNFGAAAMQYRQVIKISPSLLAAYYHLALAQLGLRQYNDALKNLEQARKIDDGIPQIYNAMGTTFLFMRDYQSAAVCFAKACNLDDSSALAQYNWGVALESLGQAEEALSHYRAAISPNVKPLSAQLRAHLYNDWGVTLYNQGRVEEAAEKLLQAIDVAPRLQEARVNLAISHLRLKEYELAASGFEDLLAASPDSLELNMYCGVAYLFMNRSTEAMEKLLRALTASNQSDDETREAETRSSADLRLALKMWIAYAHLALEDAQSALSQFQEVSQQDSNNFLALDGIGSCFQLLGEQDKAIEAFKSALKMEPASATVHMHLSRSYAAFGQMDESKSYFRKALTLDNNCLANEKEVIELLLSKSKIDLVIEHSLSILEVQSDDREAQLILASALATQSRPDEALALVQGLIASEPDNIAARTLAGQIFMQQGNFVEADEMFRLASAVHEKRDSGISGADSAMFVAWGKTLSALGFYELALDKYAKANEIDPYDSNIYEAWGETLKALGRFSEAAEVFKKASGFL